MSRADFARLAKRGRSRISEACRAGGPLAPACLLGGDIDVQHPAVADWATARGIDPKQLIPMSRAASHKPPAAEARREPATATLKEDFDALTLRKKRADVVRAETRNARDAGLLVSRALVETHVYSYLERLNLQLLGPVTQNLARQIPILAGAGAADHELQALIRKVIGAELAAVKRPIKVGITAAERAARSTERLPEVHEDQDPKAPAQGGPPKRGRARVAARAAGPRS